MTLVTDYALGLLCLVLATRMRRRGPEASRTYWSGALTACAVAAVAGGSYHGFLPWLPGWASTLLWKSTLLAIGCAAYGVSVATIRVHLSARLQRPLEMVAGLQFALYAALVLVHDEFLIAICDYSLAFGFVFVVHARVWIRTRDRAAGWILLGVLVSFAGAGIQAAGLAPHPHFNHNDLYHVVQMLGTWMLYRGASRTVQPEA